MQDYQVDIHIGTGASEKHQKVLGKFRHGAEAVLSALNFLSQTLGDDALTEACRISARRLDPAKDEVMLRSAPLCVYCC